LIKKEEDDVTIQIRKIQELAYQLKALGENISDSMIIMKILMTLPNTMNHFVSAWETTNRTLSNLTVCLIEKTKLKIKIQVTTMHYLQKKEKKTFLITRK